MVALQDRENDSRNHRGNTGESVLVVRVLHRGKYMYVCVYEPKIRLVVMVVVVVWSVIYLADDKQL